MVDEISRRNAVGVMQTLREQDRMLMEQRVMLDKFSEQVGDLIRRVAVLEEADMARRIAAMGRGPTER